MSARTVESWIRVYAAHMRSGTPTTRVSIGALPFTDSRRYDVKCKTCGKLGIEARTVKVVREQFYDIELGRASTRKVEVPACICGAEWGYEDGPGFGGGPLSALALRDLAEHRMFEAIHTGFSIADLEDVLHRFWRSRRWAWPARVLYAYALGSSVREIADEAPEVWPRSPVAWSKSSVDRMLQRARPELATRLSVRGAEVEVRA